jgi:trehalose 6-phosphate phosphatase
MEYLFTEKNLKLLESYAVAKTVYGFDFDGTLSPIVSRPEEARLPARTAELLQKLNERATVAIITGRSVSDIRKLLPFEPAYVIGNHGNEGLPDEECFLTSMKRASDNVRDMLLQNYGQEFKRMGLELEDKEYSLSLHYRNATDTKSALKLIEQIETTLKDVTVSRGKMVLNILPKHSATKGQAFLRILQKEKTKFGLYIGDDETDEDVFRFRDPHILGVRVGESSDSLANFYLHKQSEVDELLRALLNFLSHDRKLR